MNENVLPFQKKTNRPVRSNRRPPVAVYRTGLTGNGLTGYRLKPIKFKQIQNQI